jgi:mannan endo-1,4-beta-mannosidase
LGLAGLVLAASLVTPAINAATPPGFVTRTGTKLYLESAAYRFTGLNIYNANSTGSCWYAMSSGSTLDDSFAAIGSGKEATRAWFFQSLATSGGVRDWSGFDHTLAVASGRGVKVIVTLTNQWGDCELGGYKDETWYKDGYTQPDPSGTVSYRDYVAEIVARYKDDPAVLAWQLINEAEVKPSLASPNCSPNAKDILKTWASDVSGLIKSIDPNHLVSLGTLGSGQCGAQGAEYQDLHDMTTIDLCEYHDYGDPTNPMPGDPFNGLQVRLNQCAALNKPLFVGEAGIIPNDVGGTLQDRANAFAAKVSAQFQAGVAGFLAWAWSILGSTTDNFDIGPGDPALDELVGPTTFTDLALIKTDPPGRAPTGRDLTYTLTVTNHGPDDASGTTVVDQLPSSVTFVSAAPSQGSCGHGAGMVTCGLETVPTGRSATIDIVVKPTVPGIITNTASVSSSTEDPNGDNNTDAESTSVCRITSRKSSIPCP